MRKLILVVLGLYASHAVCADTGKLSGQDSPRLGDFLPGTSIATGKDIVIPEGHQGIIFEDGKPEQFTKTASIAEVPKERRYYCYIFFKKASDEARTLPRGTFLTVGAAQAADYRVDKGKKPLNDMLVHYGHLEIVSQSQGPRVHSMGCVHREEIWWKEEVCQDDMQAFFGKYLKSIFHARVAPAPSKLVEDQAEPKKQPAPADQPEPKDQAEPFDQPEPNDQAEPAY